MKCSEALRRRPSSATILVIVLIGLVVLRWQGAPVAIGATAVVAVTRAAASYAGHPNPSAPR
jgi:hypothetical protein